MMRYVIGLVMELSVLGLHTLNDRYYRTLLNLSKEHIRRSNGHHPSISMQLKVPIHMVNTSRHFHYITFLSPTFLRQLMVIKVNTCINKPWTNCESFVLVNITILT